MVWKIAGGVVLGLLFYGLLEQLWWSYQLRSFVQSLPVVPDPALKRARAFEYVQTLPAATRMVLTDVGPLSSDQACVNGVVLFIDRSVPGSTAARSFSENGRPVPCHDRMRQRLVAAPAVSGITR
jgi:hypothetical protein